MDSKDFQTYGTDLIRYIANYLDTLSSRRVAPTVEPGYLRKLLPKYAPRQAENFRDILKDVENVIMPGITHWQHPQFHAYFPAGNSYPSILADMLSGAIGCVGFSWAASPACTELEVIVLDWIAKLIRLPTAFLHESGKGGGVIQGSASECVLVTLLAARHSSIQREKSCPYIDDGLVLSKLVAYSSMLDFTRHLDKPFRPMKPLGFYMNGQCDSHNFSLAGSEPIERSILRNSARPTFKDIIHGYDADVLQNSMAHSCVEKAGMIGLVKMRQLDVDENYSLRGHTLERAIEEDRRMGLIPFYVCATLGTTGCCSFDNIAELGEVCEKEGVWLHVDAAYAGNALICPEFQYLLKGIEHAASINFNPNKWLLVNFDCSLLWVKDKKALTAALTVDPLYLQHEHDDKELDFRHWGIPLSRRFRSLKLWFVLRCYGIEGLQSYIRKHVCLAKLFERYVQNDNQFEVLGKVTMGLVCFRLKGPNALTQKLLKMINESGKLHMVPALVNENYVIRFAVCAENADEKDILYAWQVVTEMAEKLMTSKHNLEKTTEYEHMDINELSETESEDEVFEEVFDRELIFDQQRNTLRRACERRNLFHRMVSDPKGFNKTLLRALSTDGRRKFRSESDVEETDSQDEKKKQTPSK